MTECLYENESIRSSFLLYPVQDRGERQKERDYRPGPGRVSISVVKCCVVVDYVVLWLVGFSRFLEVGKSGKKNPFQSIFRSLEKRNAKWLKCC